MSSNSFCSALSLPLRIAETSIFALIAWRIPIASCALISPILVKRRVERGVGAIFLMSARTSSCNCSSGTTLLMRPIRSASSASIVSPVNKSSFVFFWPITKGISKVAGPEPYLTSGSPNFALSVAIIMSQAIASSHPPAKTQP